MLNKAKLFKEIEKLSDNIFFDYSKELELAQKTWKLVCSDQDFASKAKSNLLNSMIPTWEKNLNDKFKILPKKEYAIISVDGSQIYPDRHQGTSCSLINIGSVILNYNKNSQPSPSYMAGTASIQLHNEPYLFSALEDENSSDFIDAKRQELEFKTGLEIALKFKNSLFLFDGSLIFWHLESKSPQIKSTYLGKYLGLLHQFYKENILIAGYISFPKSKELVNLLRLKLNESFNENKIENIVDTQIAAFYLNEHEASTIFKNYSSITQEYPEHLNPHFVYLDVGKEIVRIEFPEWIAQDKEKINTVLSIILDQSIKGYGFPVCLAEAHEQAVVKNFEREQFYQLLHKMSFGYKQKFCASLKSIKKRRIGI